MAPAAIAMPLVEAPNIAEEFVDHRDGLALEATSDAVDEVNVLKAAMRVKNGTATQEEVDLYEKSQFDADKTRPNSASTKTPATASRTSTASSTRSRPWLTTSKPATTSSSRPARR